MSDPAFNPGPWRVGDTEDKHNYLQKPIWDDDGRAVVCYVVGTTNPMLDWYAGAYNYHKNAHLISAAPDLYEALAQAVTSMLDTGYRPDSVAVRACREALSKARGES